MKRFHLTHILALALCSVLATPLPAEDAARPILSLDGNWEFRMDPKDEGVAGKWFDAGVAYPDKIQVPGNWQAQGFGEPSGIAKHNYQGKAWYRREIAVPEDWQGERVWLRFEGVCNWGDVYLDGVKVGRVDSFVAPYEFDVTERVTPGRSHRLDVMVDSKPQPGAGYAGMMQFLIPAGGITSHVQLEARPVLRLDRVSLGTEAGLQGVFATVRAVREDPAAAWSGRSRLRVLNPDGSTAAEGEAALTFAAGARESAAVDVRAAFPALRPWSPDDPHLYQVAVELLDQEAVIDGLGLRTGFRTLVTDTSAGNFLLNGKVVFLSGVGYDSLEPIHGTPPPDKATYVERLRHLKNYGFNYVRFLAHTPLREFFEAADEVGILVESEGEYYAGQQPMVPGAAPLLAAQVPRLIRAFENHPSWFAFSCFNEAWDAHIDPPKKAYVQAAHKAFRELKPDHYFLASDGGHDQWPTDIITDISVMGRADEADPAPAGPPQQVFRGAVANLATFSRALADAEIQDLASGPPESDAQQQAVAKLKPAWQADGTVQAPGASLAAEAATALPERGGAMSVSLWVKPEALAKGDWGTMFSCGDATPGQSLILSLNGEAGDGRMMIGRYQDNSLASKNALVAGQWNHVALTADGKQVRLWVNGKPDGEIPAALDLPQTDLAIGRLIEHAARHPADYRSRTHVWHEMDHTYLAPLPDLDIGPRLTGAVTQSWVLEPHRRRIESYGLLPRYKEIRSLSFAHYRDYVKQSFENARRLRPRLDGYAWWVVSDIPGGVETDVTSYGVLDMLYQPEKFPDPAWFRQFNRESVLLVSADIEQRVLAAGETKPVDISLSHYGGAPVVNGELMWKATDGTTTLAEGRVSGIQAAPATVAKIASLNLGPFDFASPNKITLAVELNSTACHQSNQWEFWVFPARKQGLSPAGVVNLTGDPQLDTRYLTGDKRALPEAKVVLAKALTPELLAWVQAGGRAILLEQNTETSAVMRPSVPGSPAIPPSSMLSQPGGQSYWPLWIRCNAQWVEPHPALGDFPHDGHCGFQWMRMFGNGVPTVDFTPNDSPARKYVRPIVAGLSLIPWKEDATRYGVAMAYGAMLSECRIGSGRVLLCNLWALDGVTRGLPEAGYLLDCLVNYGLSDKPAPDDLPALTAGEAGKLFRIENLPLKQH